MKESTKARRRMVAMAAQAAALLALASTAAVAALPAPLERPAQALRQPGRGVTLGLAQAGSRIVAVGEHGAVLLSDDAGRRWRQAAVVPVGVTLTAVQFVNDRLGWAIGHQGVVLRTTDGGEHWTRQLDGVQVAQLLLQDAQTQGGTKAVADAQRAVEEGADKPLLALHFSNEREGLVAGAFGTLLATRDGGATWHSLTSRLDNPRGAHLYAIDRAGDDVLLVGEQGLVLHSVDGAQRFERITTPYGGSFFGVGRDAQGAWLVAGLRGNVLRSSDSGHSWSALQAPAPVSVTALSRDAQGGLWLANQAGQLLRPDAAAPRLKAVADTAAQQPASLLLLADGTVLLAGWSGITRVESPSR
ncbi:WD40/YVTN/BNR-like repeat-containing protein [Azohydromonas aeria]|uniref:WD40/YVTN/BNR-like repeat-containing protein n=1 Tax=Azohydromonas aeria TaxID=2590212 RepID=UPI0012FCC8BF|nr:YCF48-related protein [Azohydromonas aeria]